MRSLQLLAVLMHDEGAQAVQLVEVGLLQYLSPRSPVRWQHAGAITQEVEDQPKMLRIPVNENPPLRSTAVVEATDALWLASLSAALRKQ